jgi:hypothetical protein
VDLKGKIYIGTEMLDLSGGGAHDPVVTFFRSRKTNKRRKKPRGREGMLELRQDGAFSPALINKI